MLYFIKKEINIIIFLRLSQNNYFLLILNQKRNQVNVCMERLKRFCEKGDLTGIIYALDVNFKNK